MSDTTGRSVARTAMVPADAPVAGPFDALLDVSLPVTVILGTSTITVRRCLQLQRDSVIKLDQSAGSDLTVTINGVRVARGEVVIVEDSVAVRLTSFVKPGKESVS